MKFIIQRGLLFLKKVVVILLSDFKEKKALKKVEDELSRFINHYNIP